MLGLNETAEVLDPSSVEDARKVALANFIAPNQTNQTKPGWEGRRRRRREEEKQKEKEKKEMVGEEGKRRS